MALIRGGFCRKFKSIRRLGGGVIINLTMLITFLFFMNLGFGSINTLDLVLIENYILDN